MTKRHVRILPIQDIGEYAIPVSGDSVRLNTSGVDAILLSHGQPRRAARRVLRSIDHDPESSRRNTRVTRGLRKSRPADYIPALLCRSGSLESAQSEDFECPVRPGPPA